ncbi:MAG: hypothetical protein WC998_00480 [Candidatus Paceibacterota bacterium]|jgi:hypothetical protein
MGDEVMYCEHCGEKLPEDWEYNLCQECREELGVFEDEDDEFDELCKDGTIENC